MTSRKVRSVSNDAPIPSVISLHVASPDDGIDKDDDSFYYKSDVATNLNVVRSPVTRTLSSRSSQQTGVTLQPPGHLSLKSKKLGHRRVTEDGEVTYKKFETTQLIGSIQLGIQFAVGSQPGIPDRDILMEDFLFSETVSFTRDGLLQKTPAHRYSEFRFRTYAPYAFRFFRHLFEIDTDSFLASLCSEPMVELANPGVSGSIFYVTRDDNFICKTVQHKEADFLQKLLPGYYLNLQQNPRTLLPKFFGFYCYSCNAKNVRLVIMNNLLPSGLRMHHKFDLKGSTYKRKASRRERSKKYPTFKDLDFMEMYPEGILLQPDIYENLMNSINRDCRVLESFKIMDYSLLIGIHNLDQAAKGREVEFDGISDLQGSDNESMNTADKPSLDRQGSIQHRERMIAHSTALESITMEVGDPNLPRPSIVGGISIGADGEIFEDPNLALSAGLDNVWGGIPAKNHRGENLLLFVGIIDILQEYGVAKKMEHYWKSLIHDGDTVSVHRPSFYAKRFKQFMGEKVFRKLPSPLKSGPSVRRANLKRALSKESETYHNHFSSDPGTSNQDSGVITDSVLRGMKDLAVTVITIGDPVGTPPAGDEDPSEICLPPVLQDRKRVPSATFGGNRITLSSDPALNLRKAVVGAANRPDVVATCAAVASKLASNVNGDDVDTGSIITMTSDERVQIYVPSPLETTPYNTITRQVEQIRVNAASTWASSPSSTNVTVNGDSSDAAIAPSFNVHRVPAAHSSYRSLTPLNMDLSDSQVSTTMTSKLATCDETMIHQLTTPNETSLEMIKLSLTSSSDHSEDRNDQTEIADDVSSTTNEATGNNSLSDRTLGPEVPSLPTDQYDQSEPVSLSQIELEERIEH